MRLILDNLVPAFAVSNQRCRKSHTCLGIKQGELPRFAITIVISQPHDGRLSLSLLRHTFDMVVTVRLNLERNIEFIRSVAGLLRNLHSVDDSARLSLD